MGHLIQFDSSDHEIALIAGVLLSCVLWRLTYQRLQGFIHDEWRLLVTAVLTTGACISKSDGYRMVWLVLVEGAINPLNMEFIVKFGLALILIHWIVYSMIFHWVRWVYREWKAW